MLQERLSKMLQDGCRRRKEMLQKGLCEMLQDGCRTNMLQESHTEMLQESHTGMLQKGCHHKEIRWQNEK